MKARRWAVLAALSCACGASGASLELSIYTPAGDDPDPFEGVRQIRVMVSAPGVPTRFAPLVDVGTGATRLENLPLSRFVSVVVEGLSGVDAHPLARGYAPPVDLLEGVRVQLPVFFAKIDRFASAVTATTGARAELRDTRSGHTATLLKDGRVLVAGGAVLTALGGIESEPLGRAEIFDPARGESVAVGSMVFPRAFHTATLLKDGRVLVVGGASLISGSLSPLATAELFDPTSRTFGSAMPLREGRGRVSHTATLLPDGRVLVAGGWGQAQAGAREPLATTEIFEPGRNSFAQLGPMSTARASHTATLLLDGRVLLVGGRGASGPPVFETDVFSPALNGFAKGPNLPENQGRVGHAAVRLASGIVLVIGGCTRPEGLGEAAATVSGSGCHGQGALDSMLARVDLFDPTGAVGRFVTGVVPPLAVARADAGAVALAGDERVLVVGGMRPDGNTVAVAELIEMEPGSIGSFRPTRVTAGEAKAARAFHVVTRLASGTVLVTGGAARASMSAGFGVVSGVELYVP